MKGSSGQRRPKPEIERCPPPSLTLSIIHFVIQRPCRLFISVDDDGPGLDPSMRAEVLQRTVRESGDRSRQRSRRVVRWFRHAGDPRRSAAKTTNQAPTRRKRSPAELTQTPTIVVSLRFRPRALLISRSARACSSPHDTTQSECWGGRSRNQDRAPNCDRACRKRRWFPDCTGRTRIWR
jgi:hypothetical protein